jgi:hypothetical protein
LVYAVDTVFEEKNINAIKKTNTIKDNTVVGQEIKK